MPTLLEEVELGSRKISVSLYFHQQEREQIYCRTLDEVRGFLHKPMAKGWNYRLTPHQFEWDDQANPVDPLRPEVLELRRALGLNKEVDS